MDPEEAINNLDRAFESKLEAFHTLYDVTKKIAGFDYFGYGDTSLLIVLRNALHHRDHSLFVSWNKAMHMNGGLVKMAGAAFLLANYGGVATGTSNYFLLLKDFSKRLEHASIRDPEKLRALWDEDLSFVSIASHGAQRRYPQDQIYVNVIPVFICAVARVAKWLASKELVPLGFDGKTYATHFARTEIPRLKQPTFAELRLPYPPGS
ncbi:hypothetical protein [Cupriavidus cauae]|uniref:hypothetical protein n=1 Tax=Cupriavidus cauae TaxID=2608999 RepID=UPI001CC20711|nr:hypothetical protein [Cupriavidus cauae]